MDFKFCWRLVFYQVPCCEIKPWPLFARIRTCELKMPRRPLRIPVNSARSLNSPIAHEEGNYYTDPVTLSALQANAQIVFRYCDKDGNATKKSNPNGSIDNIAGIRNAQGNVLGLMPHPERCAEAILSNQDGRRIFDSMFTSLIGKSSVLV